MIGGVLGTLAVLVLVVVIAIGTPGKQSGHGCISVALAYSTGGDQIDRCGAAARALCTGVDHPGLTGKAGRDVAGACRKAGLPVG